MLKRQEKGGIWILVLVGICISLLFLLNHKARQNPSISVNGQMEQVAAGIEDGVEAGEGNLELFQGEISHGLQEEQNQLWILFDNLKFTRQNMQPQILFYALILILYIILIGPVAYFLLKKLDKMSWMWVYIPVLAIIFSAVIMGFNQDTKVTKPMVDALTILSPQQENVVYTASTSPGKQSYELVFGEEVKKVQPLYMGGEYELYGQDILKKSRSYTILDEGNQTILSLNPRTAFTRDYFRLDLNQTEKKSMEIKVEPVGDTGEILRGTIINHTDFDYPYVFVYYQEQYCLFKTIKKDDTIMLKRQDWKSIYHPDNIRLSAKAAKKDDLKRLLTFAYEKYMMGGETGRIHVLGVLPDYKGVVGDEGKELVSRGLFYQWNELD